MRQRVPLWIALVSIIAAPSLLRAGVPLYRNGSAQSLELALRVQVQYYHLGSADWSEQELFFRRLRPSLEATLSRAWEAEAEFDFGETIEGQRVKFKDVFVSYLGLEPKGLRLTLGNEKAAFSRQLQSSSGNLTLIDRGVVGDDDFGSLDRVLGVRLDRRDSTGHLVTAVSFGLASHHADASRMAFDSPLNGGDDTNRGWALSGRVELAPLGAVPYDEGDFGSEHLRFAFCLAAYQWSSDGTHDSYSEEGLATLEDRTDLDRSRGLELSAALRGRGLTADGEIQWVQGVTPDRAFSGGLYEHGEARLAKLSVQSGYMVLPERLELVSGYDRLDAATYESAWKRLSLGATYYLRRNELKLQVNYIFHWSFFGVSGDDPRAFVTQLQLAF